MYALMLQMNCISVNLKYFPESNELNRAEGKARALSRILKDIYSQNNLLIISITLMSTRR